MANSTFYHRPAKFNIGELGAIGGGRIPWAMSPELTWVGKVRYTDLADANQTTVITIPALTDSGRLTGTFTLNGVSAEVTADLAVGDDQDVLATDFATAMEAEGAPFSNWLVSATPGPGAGEITVVWVDGIGLVSTSIDFEPAQIIDVIYDTGTLVAGNYIFTFTGADLGGPVPVTLVWGGGNAAAFGIALEAAIEAEPALSGVVVSADDDGAGNCSVLFAPGLAAGAIAIEVPEIAHSYDLTTGGVPADGDYVVTFASDLLPAPVPVTVTRTAGAPATSALIAAAFEAAIEANPQLAPYVASADDTGAVNDIVTYPGVTFGFETSAPTGATLVAADTSDPAPNYDTSSGTPSAPSITVSHAMSLDLNSLQPRNAFPANVLRLTSPLVRRVVAWSASATIGLDDDGAASSDVLTAVSISSGTGYLGDTATSLGDFDTVEVDWTPRVVITSASIAPTAGEFEVHVRFCPLPV